MLKLNKDNTYTDCQFEIDTFCEQQLLNIEEWNYKGPSKETKLKNSILEYYYNLIGKKISLNDELKNSLSKLYNYMVNKKTNIILSGGVKTGKSTIMSSFRFAMKNIDDFDTVSLDTLKYLYRLNGLEGINIYLFNNQKDKNNYPKNLCVDDYQFDNDNILTFYAKEYDFINDFLRDRYSIYKVYKMRTYIITNNFESFSFKITDKFENKFSEMFNQEILEWKI